MTVRHPKPNVLAKQLRDTATLIDHQGADAIAKAHLLAARGWPASVNGDGTNGSTNASSSTETAALNPGPFAGIDDELATRLRAAWKALADLDHIIWCIFAHGSDDDPTPAGTGSCLRCERFCRPDATKPHNRLRSGFCPACNEAWRRAGKPDRAGFIRDRDTAA